MKKDQCLNFICQDILNSRDLETNFNKSPFLPSKNIIYGHSPKLLIHKYLQDQHLLLILHMQPILLCLVLFFSVSNAQYTVVNKEVTSSSIKLSLKYTGNSDYYVKPKSKIVKDLIFQFKALTYSQFNFKIYDPNNNRFQVPQGVPFPTDQQANFSFPISMASYKINYTTNHFSFLIVRKDTQAVLFDSSVVQLQFSEYYLQFGTITDSKTVFGFSQRFTDHFTLRKGTWTVWNKDNGQLIDVGNQLTGGLQTYGYYPVYMVRQKSGKHHIGYLRSSNAFDLQTETFSNTSNLNVYRVIGGIIDFRFILGDINPQALLVNFHQFVGRAFIPPFWAFGFHQCRWGYTNISKVQTVLQKYEQNGIPLDTIWTDIDYMYEYQTFKVDTDRFPLDRLQNITKRYRYIPIVEASARNRQSYAFEQGNKRNVFIQAAEGGNLVGKVWAGDTVFVDNFHPNTTQFWKDMLQYLYNQVQFSGVWLDMNQISNMCDGPCKIPRGQTVIDYSKDIPYQPGGKNVELSTIPLNSTHFGNRLQANVHAFFGLMESYNTFEFLKTKGRPFIVTRSHTLGSSRYAAHWTGDNFANFTFLRLSIASNFMLGMWGMQMVGSDICGFGGNATQQICARYFQLGSLYPFARDHNQFDAIDQQPYALGPIVLECSKKNLKLRYSLLKSYYREFVVRRGAGTIFRPLYFQFPQDTKLLNDDIIETQFLIGRSLMSSPIVEEGKKQRSVYFPGDIWYNIYTAESYKSGSVGTILNQLTDYVPLFIRNGHLTFRQNTANVTKTDHLMSSFELIGGFKLTYSNSTHNIYVSQGGLLSLGDYNNNQDLQKCLNQGCDLKIKATFEQNFSLKSRQLRLQTAFEGKSVRYEQKIEKFTLYVYSYGSGVINYIPKQPVSIYRQGEQVFNLDD